ncbi:winged helix-turn-helix domain-containing protein [Intestinirhabdus alba]|jgi:DNA-binding winged helix-turn-helix (wHTH) protein|uniref:Transcriptional regulator n=1 Tax=Intestinirhabdus alba TaxID=2899544 RepID=A0A6L6IKT1_9ENTR|nr:transcriptional regulator [Intestinirhabdus alba]MTH46176.1 transcriptional regulator [Intestinirhabdus alba]
MNKRYYSINNWLVDIPSGSILHLTTGERKRLGEYQLKLLETLIQGAGKIFTREELTQLVWEHRVIGNNSLPNAIHALRAALEDDGKKQKIIKTIPRKGYLLEPDYCSFIEKEESEVRDPEEETLPPEPVALFDEFPGDGGARESEAEPQPVEIPAVAPPAVKKSLHWTTLLLLVLATLVGGIAAGWYMQQNHDERLAAREIQPNVYSNIHLYSLEATGVSTLEANNVYDKLKDTFYTINQQIKMQSVRMNVYFHITHSSLNYTFSLTGQCDKKQLAMTIYHWRIVPARLNNLIIRETRRKLNEMATCKEN